MQKQPTPGLIFTQWPYCALAALLLHAGAGALASTPVLPAAPLPLGQIDLAETRSSTQLAPGLLHHHIIRGAPGIPASWAIVLPPALTRDAEQRGMKCFGQLGISPYTISYRTPGPKARRYVVVVGGNFASQTAARASLPKLPLPGCEFAIQSRAGDSDNLTGPWSIHLLEIIPAQYQGRLLSVLGNDLVKGGATTTALARAGGALAAINGGFFTIHPGEGTPGEPAGLSVTDGRLRSESTGERHFLLLDSMLPVRAAVISQDTIPALKIRWTDRRTTRVDGIDRQPGIIRNCGVRGGRPSRLPVHDMTCTIADELILLTPQSVAELPPGTATFVIKPDGRVGSSTREYRVGSGELMLAAIGKRIGDIDQRVRSGERASIDISRLGQARFAVNGGPLLVRKGRAWRREAVEGWAIDRSTAPDRAAMVHGWINRRNPRTAAGVTRDGRILLLTVDGRGYDRPQTPDTVASAGMTIEELRTVMTHLGAIEALNLDGGGSTAMVVESQLVNHPSDLAGERRVGDAVILAPR